MVYAAVDYSHMYTILTNIVHSLLVISTNLCDFHVQENNYYVRNNQYFRCMHYMTVILGL